MYSTLTPLGGGDFGLLYEAASETTGRVTAIRFVRLEREWLGAENYHLALDTSRLPLDEIVEILIDYIRRRSKVLPVAAEPPSSSK